MKKFIYISILGILLSSCAPLALKSDKYKTIYEEKPLSILVLPPINKSTKVEAKDLFYSSLIVPLSLKGYYILPPLLSMEILKEESAYNAEMFENSSMKQVGELFGADAVLFTVIHSWKKLSLVSMIEVNIEYTLKSTNTDQILFHRIGDITLTTQSGGNSLIGMVANMVSTALTHEIIVGRQCNIYTLSDLPAGKYDPLFGLDGNTTAKEEKFKVSLTR